MLSKLVFPLGLVSSALPQDTTRACHALALDEERKTFRPMLLIEEDSDRGPPDNEGIRHVGTERISQLWFAGVHANVGGGYSLLAAFGKLTRSSVRIKSTREAI